MSERLRPDPRPLADLHDEALKETDAAAAEGADRYMAWFDAHVASDRPLDAPPSATPPVAATAAPEIARASLFDLRTWAPRALPVGLAVAAALALWLVPRSHETRSHETSRLAPSPSPFSPPASPSPLPSGDPCRFAVRARGDAPSIDDFEDGNELVALREARNGYWVGLSDTDPGRAEPTLLPSTRPDASPGNRYALHVAGPKHEVWGASVQVEFGPSCYDVSSYAGIAFEARGPGRLYAGIRTVDAVPVAHGGTCTADCNRSHLGAVTLDGGWKTYVLRWGDLHQEGSTAPLDPRRTDGLEFLVRAEDTPYDTWIDDVRFVRESQEGGAP